VNGGAVGRYIKFIQVHQNQIIIVIISTARIPDITYMSTIKSNSLSCEQTLFCLLSGFVSRFLTNQLYDGTIILFERKGIEKNNFLCTGKHY